MGKGVKLLSQTETRVAVLPPPVARRGSLLAICCGAMLLYGFYLGAIGVLLPALGVTFRLGSDIEGRLFPANFAGFVIGVLLCGTLSDRLGRKVVLLLGIAVYGGGLALFGIAPTFLLALFAVALLGAGSGAMETVASAMAADLFPERRAIVLNLIQIVFGVGASLGPALAQFLLTVGISWRGLYVVLALGNLALFAALTLLPVPRHGKGEAVDFAALRAILRQPAFLTLCMAQALYVGAEVGFSAWMPTYFHVRLPGGRAWEGLVITVFWVAMTAGRFMTGGLVERVPLIRLTLLLALGGALASALALLWPAPLWVLVCVGATGLCFSGIFGLILSETGERYPAIAGTVFGGVVAAGGLGGAIVPWMIGALAATALDWRGAMLVIPLLSALLLPLLVTLKRNG